MYPIGVDFYTCVQTESGLMHFLTRSRRITHSKLEFFRVAYDVYTGTYFNVYKFIKWS